MTFDPTKISAAEIYEKMGGLHSDHQPRAMNQAARDEVYQRIRAAGKARAMITYSDLVRGLDFISLDRGPAPFQIYTGGWTGLDRKFIGGTLAQMVCDTINETGCIITSLVVDKGENAPSKILFDWLYKIDVIPDLNEVTVLSFWVHHVKLAHEYFKKH